MEDKLKTENMELRQLLIGAEDVIMRKSGHRGEARAIWFDAYRQYMHKKRKSELDK